MPHAIRSLAMPQSLSNVLVHLVFSTKERQPLLRDAAKARHRRRGDRA